MSREMDVIGTEHALHPQFNNPTIGDERRTSNDAQMISPPYSGDEIFPNYSKDSSSAHGHHHYHPWGKLYEPSYDKGRQNLSCVILKVLRFSWSFSVVFLVTLLVSLVTIGISLWLFNYYVIRNAIRQETKIQRELLTFRVLNHLENFVSSGPTVVQTIINDMAWGDRSGLNVSNTRNETSRRIQTILFFSQLKDPRITLAWFGTRYNYLTHVLINDTVNVPPRQFMWGISNGDGILYNYPMNDFLDVAPRPPDVHFGYFPTERPWYVAAQKTRAIQWGPIFFTITRPTYLTVAASGPYFDVNDGSLVGVVSASINLQTLADFLRSLVVFPETRLYVVQSDMTLVAANSGNITDATDPNNPKMVDARNSTDFVIRESAEVAAQALGVPMSVDVNRNIDLTFVDSTGKKREIEVVGFKDDFGLSWNLITVISDSVVLKVVNQSNRVLAIVTICTIIGSLLIALILSILISVPLYGISKEFVKIAKMNFARRKKKIHSIPFFEIAVMRESIKQLKNGLRCFDAYVPSDVVRVLISRNASAKLGVVRKRVSIVFIEIRVEDTNDFSPNLIVEMLQIMFTSFSQIVTDEGGVVDKYISEGIMFLFNAPLSIDNHELRSIRACCKISHRISELQEEWSKKGFPNISIQMGVNTDMCYVGNVGSRSRVNYTALGDAVNVASRLMSLNKRYDTTLMIGPKTKEAVQEQFVCRWISFVCVKGKSQPIHVFEVLSEREQATEKQKELESATCRVSQLIEENNLDSAHSLVLKLLSEYPRDKPLIELKERLEAPSFCPYVGVCTK